MLLIEREKQIDDLVNHRGAISVRELAQICDVTEVTIRRDLKKLEALNLLERTHGGAARLEGLLKPAARSLELPLIERPPADALILAPVQSHAAHLMREHALRAQIPLIAESARIDGAVYLGPQNYEGAYGLGQWAGVYALERMGGTAHVLHIILRLPNTMERSAGFNDGLRAVLGDGVQIITVDGQGLYNEAYQVALDALRVHPEINVIFGINDDSVLGGLQAYLDLDRDPEALLAVNVGGEGDTLFDVLAQGGPLKACLALFPEVVGQQAVDGVLRLWAGESIGDAIITPSAILTRETLYHFYQPVAGSWLLDRSAVAALPQTRWKTPLPQVSGRRIAFAIHFRTHEWYRNVAAAMQQRADEVGVSLSIQDVNDDVQAEIIELRRLIGKLAAAYVRDGETILLDSGTATTTMAQHLDAVRGVTVVTNSIAVLQRLARSEHVRLQMTGGELRRNGGALVGYGANLWLRELRVDKAFLVVSGVSQSFGLSCKEADEAEVRRAMINAAREVVVLADHTVLGVDSNARIAGLERVHTLITDAGASARQRLEFNKLGIRVLIAGQLSAPLTRG